MTNSDFSYRARQLQYLSFEDATPRLVGFVEWLEKDDRAKSILENLRALDFDALIAGAGFQNPPQLKTPEEVAAVGLGVIDACVQHKTEIFQVGMNIGYHGSSSRIQDTSDEVLHRLIHPFIEYVEMRLFSEEGQETTEPPSILMPINTTDIFVVHGRDNEAKETVARFVEKLGLQPIILHEQPNKGRTIIEKFEDHAEVQFAIVLITPDEIGKLAGEDGQPFEEQARQNVIFEMGYFIGKIGRERVFPLKRGSVTVPSDYNGVVYTDMDSKGAWKLELVRELKAAGFEVDANKAFA